MSFGFARSLRINQWRSYAYMAHCASWPERGLIRRHINVFVNGERGREESAVADGDRVEVLPAITGGAPSVHDKGAR